MDCVEYLVAHVHVVEEPCSIEITQCSAIEHLIAHIHIVEEHCFLDHYCVLPWVIPAVSLSFRLRRLRNVVLFVLAASRALDLLGLNGD